MDVPLFTCDQPFGTMIEDGSLPGLHKTGTFGSRSVERLAFLRERQPTGPLMCAEFWNGWFDNWGTHHHTTDAAASAAELDALLSAGASVNIYMFHGGTNFGFTNGANDKGIYEPTITSYDYDAPLSEDGYPTDKYFAFRDVIAKHFPVPGGGPGTAGPAAGVCVAVPRVSRCSARWTPWVRPCRSPGPCPSARSPASTAASAFTNGTLDRGGVLAFGEIRDRAQFFLDGIPARDTQPRTRRAHHRDPPGRAAAGPRGRPGPGQLRAADRRVQGTDRARRCWTAKRCVDWRIRPWSWGRLDSTRRRSRAACPENCADPDGVAGPSLSFATFEADGPGDRYLRLDGWTKGNAYLNGFNLGRYWSRGPQRTLYVPGPLIRQGSNDLAILELQGSTTRDVRFVSGPDLGPDEK